MNASILSDTGGTCVCTTDDLCVNDAVYLSCVEEVKRDLITTTAAIAAMSSFLMGVLANLPVGMAPGLGLNAYVSRDFPPSCAGGRMISETFERTLYTDSIALVHIFCRGVSLLER